MQSPTSRPSRADPLRVRLATDDERRAQAHPLRSGDLGCERTFGPRISFHCACGRHTRPRHPVAACEDCGVEVIDSDHRRTRVAYFELPIAVPHPLAPSTTMQILPVLGPAARPGDLEARLERVRAGAAPDATPAALRDAVDHLFAGLRALLVEHAPDLALDALADGTPQTLSPRLDRDPRQLAVLLRGCGLVAEPLPPEPRIEPGDATPFERLTAQVQALPTEARPGARADLLDDAVVATGVEVWSLALPSAVTELHARALRMSTGHSLNLIGTNIMLSSPQAPEVVARAARLLTDAALGWLMPSVRYTNADSFLKLHAALALFGARYADDFAARWLARFADTPSRAIWCSAYGFGVRIAWADGPRVRLQAFHRGLYSESLLAFPDGAFGSEPGLIAITAGTGRHTRSAVDVPRGQPLGDLDAASMPIHRLCHGFGSLTRRLALLRARAGEHFTLGPLTERVAWWTDDDRLLLHHIGLEAGLRDAPGDTRIGEVWDGPRESHKGGVGGSPSDVFFIAALFHRLIAGNPPADFAAMRDMIEGRWPPLDERVPTPLAAALGAALGLRPDRPSLASLAAAFEAHQRPAA